MENSNKEKKDGGGNIFTKIIRTRAFLAAVIFAVSLWSYTNLNEEFYTTIQLPLKIILPENKSIENSGTKNFPNMIPVEIKGNGWNLFNLTTLNRTAEIIIDLSGKDIDTTYQISRNEILDNVKYLGNARAVSTTLQPITLKIGKVGEYSVPLISRVVVKPRDGFIIIEDVTLKPDLINIRGNDKVASSIKYWYTMEKVFTDVDRPVSYEVPLNDSLKNIITLSQEEVKAYCDVQQQSEITFDDIPLTISGREINDKHLLLPMKLSVTLRSGINLIAGLNPNQIKATVDYNEIMNDDSGILIPDVKVPDKIKVINISPPYIYHYLKIRD
jgi:hypothetical protein